MSVYGEEHLLYRLLWGEKSCSLYYLIKMEIIHFYFFLRHDRKIDFILDLISFVVGLFCIERWSSQG